MCINLLRIDRAGGEALPSAWSVEYDSVTVQHFFHACAHIQTLSSKTSALFVSSLHEKIFC